jgi:hypothetical protein
MTSFDSRRKTLMQLGLGCKPVLAEIPRVLRQFVWLSALESLVDQGEMIVRLT